MLLFLAHSDIVY